MQINSKIVEKTRKYVKEVYKKIHISHNWEGHVKDVVHNAKYIARKEGMNVKIVEMGALLHDIGRVGTHFSKEHATPSAKKAEKFLTSLKLDKEVIEKIIDTVQYHSRKVTGDIKTREALAVFDADKLNHIGPKGMIRTVLWIEHKYPEREVNELFFNAVKVEKDRIKRMKTKTGKALGKKYISYTKEFIKGYKEQNANKN